MLTVRLQDGQITDPPASSGVQNTSGSRYAHHPSARSPSPSQLTPSASFSASEAIFCDTCLKNQHILNENKASVHPPAEGSAHYADYLANLESLERRYPQVCERCRPRARQAIMKANYTAKADNLRRTMDKTRSHKVPVYSRDGRVWRSLVLRLAGLGWFLSVLAQVFWHSLGARIDGTNSGLQDEELRLEMPQSASALAAGLRQNMFETVVDLAFFRHIAVFLPLVLSLGAATIWWNIKLRRKYLGLGGRMIGTRDYYLVQVFALALRAAAWWGLASPDEFTFGEVIFRRAHAFMAVFLVLITVRSTTIVRIDSRPRVFYPTVDDANILPDTPRASRAGRSENAIMITEQKSATFNSPAAGRKSVLGVLTDKSRNSYTQAGQPEQSRWAAPYISTHQSTGSDFIPFSKANAQLSPVRNNQHHLQQDHASPASRNSPVGEPMDCSPSLPSSFSSNSNTASDNERYSLRSRASPMLNANRQPQQQLGATSFAAAARKMPYTPRNGKSNGNGLDGLASLGIGDKAERSRAEMFDDASTEADDAIEIDENEYGDNYGRVGIGTNAIHKSGRKSKGKIDMKMQPTRLWLNEDRIDTGLEDMFDQVFSLGRGNTGDDEEDEGNEVTKHKKSRVITSGGVDEDHQGAVRPWVGVAVAMMMSVGIIVVVAMGVKTWKTERVWNDGFW